MNPRTAAMSRTQKSSGIQREGPNWVLIAGGALLSTLSFRLGYKLKQATDTKQADDSGNGKSTDRRKQPTSRLHSNMYSYMQGNDGCFNCFPGNEGVIDPKHPSTEQMLEEPESALPLVTVPAPEYNRENGVTWASSPDRFELPPKPFHPSNCSESPCVSESGSDIFSKREVIHKLRQQLKRRDDMILEMQDQITELQNSFNAQLEQSTHLQAQLDAANRDLFDSEREIQRLRKAIADHCVGHVGVQEKNSTAPLWPPELRNGHANGHVDGENNRDSFEKARDMDKIEMLRKEVGELKEVIEGKEFLLQSYKEQKAELSLKIRELQQRLDSQLPSIL